jgi:hypothetical protein
MRVTKEALLNMIGSLDYEFFEINHNRTLYDAAPHINTLSTSKILVPKCEPYEQNEISINFTREIKGVVINEKGDPEAIPLDEIAGD